MAEGKSQYAGILNTAKIMVYFGLWYFLNAVYNVYNKRVLNKVNIPWTLATSQFVVGCVWFLPLWLTGLRPAPKFAVADLKWLLPLGFFHSLVHISSVIAMGAGGVSFFQIVKAAEPLFTATFSAVLFKEFFHPAVYMCILPVVGGVSYASVSTLDFSWLAFVGAMLSNLGSVCRAVYSKPKLKNPPETTQHLNPGNLFSLITLISIFFCSPLAILVEFREIYDLIAVGAESQVNMAGTPYQTVVLWALISGITFYTYNEVAYYALQEVHPITHAVGNTLKRVIVITAAVIFLNESMTTEMIIGTVIAIAGVLGYSLSKHYFAKKKPSTDKFSPDLKRSLNGSEVPSSATNV
jgi:solute carrier family 35 protein E1